MTFEEWFDDQNVFSGQVPEHIARMIYTSILRERQECANVCTDLYDKCLNETADRKREFLLCAMAIHERSNK